MVELCSMTRVRQPVSSTIEFRRLDWALDLASLEVFPVVLRWQNLMEKPLLQKEIESPEFLSRSQRNFNEHVLRLC